jgi:hypothetical protein
MLNLEELKALPVQFDGSDNWKLSAYYYFLSLYEMEMAFNNHNEFIAWVRIW